MGFILSLNMNDSDDQVVKKKQITEDKINNIPYIQSLQIYLFDL